MGKQNIQAEEVSKMELIFIKCLANHDSLRHSLNFGKFKVSLEIHYFQSNNLLPTEREGRTLERFVWGLHNTERAQLKNRQKNESRTNDQVSVFPGTTRPSSIRK